MGCRSIRRRGRTVPAAGNSPAAGIPAATAGFRVGCLSYLLVLVNNIVNAKRVELLYSSKKGPRREEDYEVAKKNKKSKSFKRTVGLNLMNFFFVRFFFNPLSVISSSHSIADFTQYLSRMNLMESLPP